MPKYLCEAAYTPEGIQDLVGDSASGRRFRPRRWRRFTMPSVAMMSLSYWTCPTTQPLRQLR